MKLMDDFFNEQPNSEATFAVAKSKPKAAEEEGQLTVDVYQTEEEIIVKSTIAGVTADDMDISITNDMVTVKGVRKPDDKIKAADYYYQELYWGPFSRSIILPEEIDSDNSKAILKNGILTVRMPKLARTRIKRIKVSS